jgi:hypothetical protein
MVAEEEGSMTQLERVVVEFKPEELIIRALYKTDDAAKLAPNTKARTREVSDLAQAGLTAALEALEDGAECVGTSGFLTRQDILVALPRPDEPSEAEAAS